MNKKINNKGFTLIELLATIVILGLIATVTVIAVTGAYQKSREKAEEAFRGQIKNHIYDYITLNSSRFNYISYGRKLKCHKNFDEEICNEIEVYKSEEYFIENINSITNKDLRNPKSNIPCTNDNTTLTVYRDKDYVYCLILEPEDNSCINEKIDTCSSLYKNW